MQVSVELGDWLLATQVLSAAHVTRTAAGYTLSVEATRAADTGHLAFYVAHNLAAQLGLPFPRKLDKELQGSPGEMCGAPQKKHNWILVTEVFGGMGMPVGALPEVDTLATSAAIQRFFDDLRIFWSSFDEDQRLQPTTHPAESAIRASHDRFLRRLAEKAAAEAREAKRQQNASLLRDAVVMSLDVSRYRLDLKALGGAPLAVYTEFKNRAVVQFCHSLVESMIYDVESGSAAERITAERRERLRIAQHSKERRAGGRRLLDLRPAVQVDRKGDHRVALFIKDIVVEIVNRCTLPDILDVLERRDVERSRNRAIVHRIHTRFQAELEEKAMNPPLRLRMEQAKKESMAQQEEERRLREERIAAMREANKSYAHEQLIRKQDKQQLDWASAAAERDKARKIQGELEEHRAKAKASAIHNRMRRLLSEMEAGERSQCISDEAALWKRILGVATRERREIIEAETARGKQQTIPLSSVSVGTGLGAAYQGTSYGSQFLTAFEVQLLDTMTEFRADPSSFVKRLSHLRQSFQNNRMLVPCRNGQIEPMVTVEGVDAVDHAVAALSRARACRPPQGEPSIGLTLAAREHAADMVYHGIANSVQHLGSDGSTTSQRVFRYGYPANLNAAACTELIAGFVRPSSSVVAPEYIVLQWLLCDGEATRTMRRALLGNGNGYASVGVGHACATLNERTVEVYVALYSAEFCEKPVSQMAAAHQAALSEVAPPFLQGCRTCHASVTPASLIATTNCVIGRTAPPPNLKHLTDPRRSPRRVPRTTIIQQRNAIDVTDDQSPSGAIGISSYLAPTSPEARHQQQLARLPRLMPIANAPTLPSPNQHDVCPVLPEPKRKERFVGLQTPLPLRVTTSNDTKLLHRAATAIQRTFRGFTGRKDARLDRTRHDALVSERATYSVLQECHHAVILIEGAFWRRFAHGRSAVRLEPLNAAQSVIEVIVDRATDSILRRSLAKEWSTRCILLLTGPGHLDQCAADAELGNYANRELQLLSTLVGRFGTEDHLVKACNGLGSMLGCTEEDCAILLDGHVGYEADLLSRMDRIRACCMRCAAKWRRSAAKRVKRNGAAVAIQRWYRRCHTEDRRNYVARHRRKAELKHRLQAFYSKYNPAKLSDVDALVTKYEGSETCLFQALEAKYGPE